MLFFCCMRRAVAACVGTRDDGELAELFDNAEHFDLSFFSNNTLAEFAKHFLRTGTLQDGRVLATRLERLLGNATFLQAFQHSGARECAPPFFPIFLFFFYRLP
jgi:TAG lipase/steryl ester hydrolase/phospholipase A2/LPA acyltransferase